MNTRIADDHVRLSIEDASALSDRALVRLGLPMEEARAVTAHLVDAACCGYAFAGLPRILEMAKDPTIGGPRRPMRVVKETAVSMLLDGGDRVGYYTVYEAGLKALEKAQTSGIAVVGLHNSIRYSGRIAYYLEPAARAGFVAMLFSSALPTVAPEGGARPMLGTNPIAIALPTSTHPVIFDMGTAAIARGDVSLHAFLGKELPEGVAIGPDGMPTRDARQAIQGSILPFGGRDSHKGYGLSLMVQSLSLLAGASFQSGGVQEWAQLFIVFDPDLLVSRNRFRTDMDELVARIKATPRRPGVGEIRIPSERAFRLREKSRVEGIEISREVYEGIRKIAEGADSGDESLKRWPGSEPGNR